MQKGYFKFSRIFKESKYLYFTFILVPDFCTILIKTSISVIKFLISSVWPSIIPSESNASIRILTFLILPLLSIFHSVTVHIVHSSLWYTFPPFTNFVFSIVKSQMQASSTSSFFSSSAATAPPGLYQDHNLI